MELYDIKNLSSSAFETSMSFGISLDSFERLAVEVNRINAVEIKTLTEERDKWYDEFSKVENEANALTIERDDLALNVESLTEQLKHSWENEPEWIDELRQHAKGTLGRACEERDTYKQALDDLGVTPAEAKAGVARSKALLAERDALKSALEESREAELQIQFKQAYEQGLRDAPKPIEPLMKYSMRRYERWGMSCKCRGAL